MNIQRYIIPASLAAALHVALVLGFNAEPGPVTGVGEIPLPPLPAKPPDDPVVLPPEEKSSLTETVRPLGGGPPPPDIDPPPAKPAPDAITVPVDENRFRHATDLKIVPTTFGPGEIGTVPGGWKSRIAGIDDLDRVPRATVQIPPDYPAILRQNGSSGSVLVEFEVNTEGRVVRAAAMHYSQREFAEPAVRAVLKWRFEPGVRNGRAVPFRMAIPIEFTVARD